MPKTRQRTIAQAISSISNGRPSSTSTSSSTPALVGYYYDQITGDSGAGASGPFEGRVTAVGATLGLNFQAGSLPVSTRLKYFHEFNAENRAEGDAAFVTLSMPL
ncbi:MAG: transporter [Parvibaculaceae bacterium]